MRLRWQIFTLLALAPTMAAADADLGALWDFGQPAASRQRFEAAAAAATDADEAFVLRTQVARAQGLEGRFDSARQALKALEAERDRRSARARAHWWLEWGRAHASVRHAPGEVDGAARATAQAAWREAAEAARLGAADELVVDALHMQAIVATEPAERLRLNGQALEVALASPQPPARRWEASLRHNLGVEHQQAERHDLALPHLERALLLRRERESAAAAGTPQRAAAIEARQVAAWMVARSLRGLGRRGEALAIQRALAAEHRAAGTQDRYVDEELALLEATEVPAAPASSPPR